MRHNGSTSTTDCIEWRRVTDLKREHNESAIGVTVPNAYTRSSLDSSQLRHACSVYVGVYASLLIVHYSCTCIWSHSHSTTTCQVLPYSISLSLPPSTLARNVTQKEKRKKLCSHSLIARQGTSACRRCVKAKRLPKQQTNNNNSNKNRRH